MQHQDLTTLCFINLHFKGTFSAFLSKMNQNAQKRRTCLSLCLNVKIFVMGLFYNAGKWVKERFQVVEEQPHYAHQAAQLFCMKWR